MKKDITIRLNVNELIYDVQNKTHITGKSRENGQNYELVANMKANDDDEDIDQLTRSIQSHLGTLRVKLGEYTNEIVGQKIVGYTGVETNGVTAEQLSGGVTEAGTSISPKGSEVIVGHNDIMNRNDKVELTLHMPSNFNVSVAGSIASMCHRYIVFMTIADWFLMTDKADAAEYLQLSASNLEQLRDALSKRVRPTRRG